MALPPKSLFRYRSLTAYSLGELINETMWYSKPASFNDPFDCALTIDQRKFEESLEHAIEVGIAQGKIRKNLSESERKPTSKDREVFLKVREMMRRSTQELGLCCFSEDPKSILMWAHYANNHRGFCVEYSLAPNSMLSEEVSRVSYMRDMPSLTISDISPKNSAKTVERLWRTKANCWRYEKEWRALASSGDQSYPSRSPVLSVIFGQRMPPDDRQLIQRAMGERQVRFREAYMHENRFAILLRSLDVA